MRRLALGLPLLGLFFALPALAQGQFSTPSGSGAVVPGAVIMVPKAGTVGINGQPQMVPAAPPNGLAVYESSASNVNISTKTDTQAKTGAGTLAGVSINTFGTSDTLTIYDGASCTGTKIATITVATPVSFYRFGAAFTNGLCITSGGGAAGNYTVMYQ